jgi:galactitol-specific phosphotransferase system IIB component
MRGRCGSGIHQSPAIAEEIGRQLREEGVEREV